MSDPSGIRSRERRRFIQLVGLAGISSAVGMAMTSWAAPPPSGKSAKSTKAASAKPPATAAPKSAEPARADSAAAAAPKPPEISADARALAALVERRYGQHLDAKQLEAVTLEIENRLQGGKRLRDAKLANADEPDFMFRA